LLSESKSVGAREVVFYIGPDGIAEMARVRGGMAGLPLLENDNNKTILNPGMICRI